MLFPLEKTRAVGKDGETMGRQWGDDEDMIKTCNATHSYRTGGFLGRPLV